MNSKAKSVTSFVEDGSIVTDRILGAMKKYSDNTAISANGVTITYLELERRSGIAALQLDAEGIRAGTLIPIITSGGAEMICAMIGILRAGASFVPIDSSTPKSRILEMLKTIDAPFSIIDSKIQKAPDYWGRVITLDSADSDSNAAFVPASGEDLAYGFFTSGSTGKPKCCLNIHKGLANRFTVMSDTFGLKPGEAVLQNSKHTFDSSLWQILWPLCVGGKVVIPNRDGILDIPETIQTICDENIVMTDFVPSIFDVFLSHVEKSPEIANKLRFMRHVLVGGEEVSAKIINRSKDALPWIRITNTYGPTEASIGMVFNHFEKYQSDPIPLGKPIANTYAEVVDENLVPVKSGEIGQIVIGGTCMGLGYLGEKEKTEKAFIEAPELGLKSNKVFLTGDLGHLKEGLLYFNGRVDHQVKIRGVRIELNEIEGNLEAIEGVEQARVVTRDDSDGHKSLVAFLVGDNGLKPNFLRTQLSEHLSPEFLPAIFKFIDQFPRTTSGKIDRGSLKQMAENRPKAVPPKIEKSISIIQGTLFSIIGIEIKNLSDNFFDLGLDSLNAVRFALDLETALEAEISASDIYDNPTIDELSRFIINGNVDRTLEPAHGSENALVQEWKNYRVKNISNRPSILLTGATGYVGSHLLRELVKTTSSSIICMIRAKNETAARDKIEQAFKTFGLDFNFDTSRVEILCGDLDLPKAGISLEKWKYLGQNVSDVYHAAAAVNFVQPFSELCRSNTEGTAILADFAYEYGIDHFHFISTVSVLSEVERSIRTKPFDLQNLPSDGYSQSKLAAEYVVTNLSQKGISTTIYRLGEVMPSPAYPNLNPKALTTRLIKSFIELHIAYDSDEKFNYSSIDIVAQIIVNHRKDKTFKQDMLEILDVSNPDQLTIANVIDALNQAGNTIQIKSKNDFQIALNSHCSTRNASIDCLVVHDTIRGMSDQNDWELFKTPSNKGNSEFQTNEVTIDNP